MLLKGVRKAPESVRRVLRGHQLCEGHLHFHSLPIIVLPILYSWLLPYLRVECLWGIFHVQVVGDEILVRLEIKSSCVAMKARSRKA